MSRNNQEREFDLDEGRPGGGAPRGRTGGRRFRRRKVCRFCADKVDHIDFKDVKLLSGYVPERSKILPRRISGVCSQHQRQLTDAIKKARNIALLAFATE